MSVRRKSGFTLIELLVVIAIIAILAAILFPVFARARETARKASCQSNLKQCAQALKMYVDDYDGEMPTPLLWNTNLATAYPIFGCQLCNGNPTDATNGYPGTTRVTWAQMLYDNMRSKNVIWCPSDSTDHAAVSPTISYWYKYANAYAYTMGKRKMSDYGYESDQVAFYEYNGWHFSDSTGMHVNSEINAAFLDSHVEKVTLPVCAAPTANPTNDKSESMAAYSPMFYNVYLETISGGNSISTTAAGQGWDPSTNYDKF